MRLPARRMLNVIWQWAIMKIEPKDREEWVVSMNKPIPAPGPLLPPLGPEKKTAIKAPVSVEELQADKAAWLSAAGR